MTMISNRTAMKVAAVAALLILSSCGDRSSSSKGAASEGEETELAAKGLEELKQQSLPIDTETSKSGGSGKLTLQETRIALAKYCNVLLKDDAEVTVVEANYKFNRRAVPKESLVTFDLVFPEEEAMAVYAEAVDFLRKTMPKDYVIKEKVLDYDTGKFGIGSKFFTRRDEYTLDRIFLALDPKKGLLTLSVTKGEI